MLQLRTVILGCAAVVAFASVANAELMKVDYTGATAVGLVNTVAGGNGTLAVAGTNYYGNESPTSAIDGDTSTKLCISSDFGNGSSGNSAGNNTGLYITLAVATKVTAIQFTTANDCVGHDSVCRTPLTITVEGSNATGSDLLSSSSWTSLYSGTAGLDSVETIFTAGSMVSFANTTAFSSYRVLITATYGSSANSTQFSEVALYSVPEPSTMLLGITGAAALLAYAWRRRRN